MMDPRDGIWKEIFNGELDYPTIRSYIVRQGIEASLAYRFKVKAAYLNGYTDESAEAVIYACTQPSQLAAPTLVEATSTAITVQWKQPLDNGGCPIKGFALYMNDGAGGHLFTEIDSALVRDKPGYTIHQTSALLFPQPASVGKKYAFKVEAYNIIGSTFSVEGASFTLADEPEDPLVAPSSDESYTSDKRIKIDITPLTIL